jgi:16S rRNA processing protein RimM
LLKKPLPKKLQNPQQKHLQLKNNSPGMKKDELFRLGKIVRTFGPEGELILQIETDLFTGIKKLESVFLDLNGNLIPFFIDALQTRPGKMLQVRFFDVNQATEAEKLKGCGVYISPALLPAEKKHPVLRGSVEGYRIIDSVKGECGTVSEILDMPQQTLLSVTFGEKEILIPVVEEIITDIDHKKKIIYISAPEGLIDLYL